MGSKSAKPWVLDIRFNDSKDFFAAEFWWTETGIDDDWIKGFFFIFYPALALHFFKQTNRRIDGQTHIVNLYYLVIFEISCLLKNHKKDAVFSVIDKKYTFLKIESLSTWFSLTFSTFFWWWLPRLVAYRQTWSLTSSNYRCLYKIAPPDRLQYRPDASDRKQGSWRSSHNSKICWLRNRKRIFTVKFITRLKQGWYLTKPQRFSPTYLWNAVAGIFPLLKHSLQFILVLPKKSILSTWFGFSRAPVWFY